MKRTAAAVFAAVVITLLVPSIAAACPVCYGAPDDPMVKATNKGIGFLLGIVGFVQLGFIALFGSFWYRARKLKRFREQFRVIEGGSPR